MPLKVIIAPNLTLSNTRLLHPRSVATFNTLQTASQSNEADITGSDSPADNKNIKSRNLLLLLLFLERIKLRRYIKIIMDN